MIAFHRPAGPSFESGSILILMTRHGGSLHWYRNVRGGKEITKFMLLSIFAGQKAGVPQGRVVIYLRLPIVATVVSVPATCWPTSRCSSFITRRRWSS
jgi:hypothetical protein